MPLSHEFSFLSMLAVAILYALFFIFTIFYDFFIKRTPGYACFFTRARCNHALFSASRSSARTDPTKFILIAT